MPSARRVFFFGLAAALTLIALLMVDRLEPRLGPAACSEASALADPAALLVNRSPD
jgi:hypothetical protein